MCVSHGMPGLSPGSSTLGARSLLDRLEVLEGPKLLEALLKGQSSTWVDDKLLVVCQRSFQYWKPLGSLICCVRSLEAALTNDGMLISPLAILVVVITNVSSKAALTTRKSYISTLNYEKSNLSSCGPSAPDPPASGRYLSGPQHVVRRFTGAYTPQPKSDILVFLLHAHKDVLRLDVLLVFPGSVPGAGACMQGCSKDVGLVRTITEQRTKCMVVAFIISL